MAETEPSTSAPESTTQGASLLGRVPRPRGEYRPYICWCAGLLSAHALSLFFPESYREPCSECIFLADSALALYYLNRARVRSSGNVRTFWLLFSVALWVFAGATLVWLGDLLLGPMPFPALVPISYRLYAMPLAMILFLPGEERHSRWLHKEAVLDFLQLGILCWLALFVLYYLPSRSLGTGELQQFGAVRVGDKINLVLLGLSFVRWRTENSPQMRSLRGRLAAFLAFYSLVSAAGNYIDPGGRAVAAFWFDLFWAVPYLLAAGVAVNWTQEAVPAQKDSLQRTMVGLLFENLSVAGICLAVAVLSDRVPEPWHSLANVAVGISLLAYSARLTISQHRQQKELHSREQTEMQLREARDELAASLQSARSRAIELNLLTELGHFLQACVSEDEAYKLVGSALKQIVPQCSGSLYTVSVRDKRANSVREWGEAPPALKTFEPQACWAVRRHRSHSGNERGGVVCSHLPESESHASLCVPLLTSGEVTGILVLVCNPEYRSQPEMELRKIFTKARRVVGAVAEQTGLTLTNLRLRAAMQEQAIRDSLTGLYNRRHLEEMLNHELLRAQRQGRNLSVLMLDLDHFKRLNDTFGHEAGDTVLRAMGAYFRSCIRSADVACRFGGEEFVVLMPEAQLLDAARRAQEICDGVRALSIEYPGNRSTPVTVSIGVTSLSPTLKTSAQLLQAADAALYHAKHAGRDCVGINENGSLSLRKEELAPLTRSTGA